MGKKRRRKQKRPLTRRIPWLWLGLGGAAVLALGLLLWQPWSGDEPSVTPQVSGAPRLRVDQTVVDEGYVRYSVPVRTTFRLTNVGDQPLEILNRPQVQLVEGCWPPEAVVSSTTIKPGKTALLTMDYTMPEGMGGPHEFHVYLRTNDPVESTRVLVAKSDWGP